MRGILLLIATITLGSCQYASVEPKFSGNYPANISAIMEANCLGGDCHSGSTELNTHLDLSSWEAMTKGSIYFNEIIPFNIRKSHLFGHINTDTNVAPVIIPTMPTANTPLSASDQKTIFDWIGQGAQSADGRIPYSDVTKKIFVASEAEGMVSVIDADTKRLVRVILTSVSGDVSQPTTILMTPDHKGFIAGMLGGKGMIRKFDAASYLLSQEFASNLAPNEIAVTPDGSKGYVTDNSSLTSTNYGVFDPIAN